MPATAEHPDATGRFRALPDAQHPGLTDLGVWNVFANPDFPKTQVRLWQILCDEELGGQVPTGFLGFFSRCAPSSLLPKTIALFKTPGLRDLSHSAPYIHNGRFDTPEDGVELYRSIAPRLPWNGRVRSETAPTNSRASHSRRATSRRWSRSSVV